MAAFVALAILARKREAHFAAGLALGLAVMTKFLPLLLLPALWRRWDWRLPLGLVLVVVLGYLVFIGAGWQVLGFLPGYAGEEGLEDGTGFWLLGAVSDATDLDIPVLAYVAVVGIAMGGLAIWIMFKLREDRRPVVGSYLLAATGMFALSPNYPWYFAWLLPIACLTRPIWPVIWLVAVGPLLYSLGWSDDDLLWSPNVVYGGAYVVFLASVGASTAHHFIARRKHSEPQRIFEADDTEGAIDQTKSQ